MTFIYEKLAYLRGLCDGSGFDESTKEGKIFNGILDVLDELTNIVEEVKENNDGLEHIDDESDDEDAEYSYAFICPSCGEEIEVDDDIIENDEEVACPKCGNVMPVCPENFDMKF